MKLCIRASTVRVSAIDILILQFGTPALVMRHGSETFAPFATGSYYNVPFSRYGSCWEPSMFANSATTGAALALPAAFHKISKLIFLSLP